MARSDGERLKGMISYDAVLRQKGYKLIAGVDEAGRGPLAGPVVAAAVILPESPPLLGVNDSKKLGSKKREELYSAIREVALDMGVGIVGVEVIDRVNILKATYQAMKDAIANLRFKPDCLLIDALTIPQFEGPQFPIVKGDALSLSIAAASIIAKVTRDRIMGDLDKNYPQYGFAQNKGYATRFHLDALCRYGPCEIHRRSFYPISHFKEWSRGWELKLGEKGVP